MSSSYASSSGSDPRGETDADAADEVASAAGAAEDRPRVASGRTRVYLAGAVLLAVALIVLVVPSLSTGGPDVIPARGEAGGTGYFPVAPITVAGEAWRTDPIRRTEGSPVSIQAVRLGGTVVAVAEAGLVGLDPEDGRLRWRLPLGAGAGQASQVGDQVVVSVGADLVAVDETGAVRWRTEVAADGADDTDPLRAPVVVAADEDVLAVVIGVDGDGVGGRLVGIDVSDGSRLWTADLDGEEAAPWIPAGGPTTMTADGSALVRVGREETEVVETPSGRWPQRWLEPGPLAALDLRSGEERWRTEAGGYWVHGVADGTILYTVESGAGSQIVARDPASGDEHWRTSVAREIDGLAVTGGHLYLGTRDRIIVLDTETGEETDPIPFEDGLHHLYADGAHLIVSGAGSQVVIDAAEREVVWTPEPGSFGPVLELEDALLVSVPDGLAAIDPDRDEERWRFTSRHPGSCVLQRFGHDLVVTSHGEVFTLDPGSGDFRQDLAEVSRSLSRSVTAAGDRTASAAIVGEGEAARLLTAVGPADGVGQTVVRAWEPGQREPVWEEELRRMEPALVSDGLDVVLAGGTGVSQPVVGISVADGAERWDRSPADRGGDREEGQPPSPAAVLTAVDGRLILGGPHTLMGWDLEDGGDVWSLAGEVEGDGWGSWPRDVVGRQDLLIARWATRLLALDPSDGSELWGVDLRAQGTRWERRTAAAVTLSQSSGGGGTPVVTDDLVLLAEGHADLVALDAASGELRWRATLGAPPVAGTSVAGDRVHVATAAGVETLDLATGEPVDEIEVDRLVISPPLLDGERLYACLADGTVAAFD